MKWNLRMSPAYQTAFMAAFLASMLYPLAYELVTPGSVAPLLGYIPSIVVSIGAAIAGTALAWGLAVIRMRAAAARTPSEP